jgi:hypothetical protein
MKLSITIVCQVMSGCWQSAHQVKLPLVVEVTALHWKYGSTRVLQTLSTLVRSWMSYHHDFDTVRSIRWYDTSSMTSNWYHMIIPWCFSIVLWLYSALLLHTKDSTRFLTMLFIQVMADAQWSHRRRQWNLLGFTESVEIPLSDHFFFWPKIIVQSF